MSDRMQDLEKRRGADFVDDFLGWLGPVCPEDLTDDEFTAHEKWVTEQNKED